MPSLLLFGGGAAPPAGPITLTAVNGGASAVVEKRGGTVVTLTGTGFDNTLSVQVLFAAATVGEGYIFDPEFDVTSARAYVGLPALTAGVTYDLQVTVGAATAQLVGALLPQLYAEEAKTHQVRQGFAEVWAVGPRILTNPILDLGAL